MAANLPLGQMSLEGKLEAMELLWEDLSATPEQVVSPAWHGVELQRRREQVQQGSARFQSWNDAITDLKAELRGQQTGLGAYPPLSPVVPVQGKGWLAANVAPAEPLTGVRIPIASQAELACDERSTGWDFRSGLDRHTGRRAGRIS